MANPHTIADSDAIKKHSYSARGVEMFLRSKGHFDIIKTVKIQYPDFGKAPHKDRGWENNTEGLQKALELLDAEDKVLATKIRAVLTHIPATTIEKRESTEAASAKSAPLPPIENQQPKIPTTLKTTIQEKLDAIDKERKLPVEEKPILQLATDMPKARTRKEKAIRQALTKSLQPKPQAASKPSGTVSHLLVKDAQFSRRTAIATTKDKKVIWQEKGICIFTIERIDAKTKIVTAKNENGTKITFHAANWQAVQS